MTDFTETMHLNVTPQQQAWAQEIVDVCNLTIMPQVWRNFGHDAVQMDGKALIDVVQRIQEQAEKEYRERIMAAVSEVADGQPVSDDATLHQCVWLGGMLFVTFALSIGCVAGHFTWWASLIVGLMTWPASFSTCYMRRELA